MDNAQVAVLLPLNSSHIVLSLTKESTGKYGAIRGSCLQYIMSQHTKLAPTTLTLIQRLKDLPKAEQLFSRDLPGGIDLEAMAGEDIEAFAAEVRDALQQFKPGSLQYQAAEEVAGAFEELLVAPMLCPIVLIEKPPPKPLSRQQKQALATQIHSLAPKQLSHIMQLVRKFRRSGPSDRFEFDLNALPVALCCELQLYVNRCREKEIIVLSDSDELYLP